MENIKRLNLLCFKNREVSILSDGYLLTFCLNDEEFPTLTL